MCHRLSLEFDDGFVDLVRLLCHGSVEVDGSQDVGGHQKFSGFV
jgi:hypothetical protein